MGRNAKDAVIVPLFLSYYRSLTTIVLTKFLGSHLFSTPSFFYVLSLFSMCFAYEDTVGHQIFADIHMMERPTEILEAL